MQNKDITNCCINFLHDKWLLETSRDCRYRGQIPSPCLREEVDSVNAHGTCVGSRLWSGQGEILVNSGKGSRTPCFSTLAKGPVHHFFKLQLPNKTLSPDPLLVPS